MSQPDWSLLTVRQFLQQCLPPIMTDFGDASSARNQPDPLPCLACWDDLPRLVDTFVGELDDSTPCVNPVDRFSIELTGGSETAATFCLAYALRRAGDAIGHNVIPKNQVPVKNSGPHVGANQLAVTHAASPSSTPKADLVANVGGNDILVIEMKKPRVFRSSTDAPIPSLHLLGETVVGSPRPPPSLEDVVRLEALQELYKYMVCLNLRCGILSSFDLTYVAHRQGLPDGDMLVVSMGIPSTSPRFFGTLAYMLQKSIDEPSDFMMPVPQPILLPHSLKRQSFEGDNEGEAKKKRVKQQLRGMRTRSQGLLPETPAELLHLAKHHFATGWSGNIVRGTYEGQSVVVKLAPIGSNRAEALQREVLAYHKLKQFWGKYVPRLVSYGTTVGGTIMYIATEEFKGYQIGKGPLSKEVLEEIFDALGAVHQCGILHGDIRPSNILVAQGEQACVRFVDFGFACVDTSDDGCKTEYAQLKSLVRENP